MRISVLCLLILGCFVGNLQGDDDFIDGDESGYCAPYNGKVCKSNVVSTQVWYTNKDSTGGWKNEQITEGLWRELILGLDGLCRSPAEKLLCAYAFPQCITRNGTFATKLPLCYEDCIATKLQFCYNDWIVIEERKQKNIFLESRGHFRFPNCDTLPKYNKTARPPTCSYLGLTEMKDDEITCKYFFFYLFLFVSSVQFFYLFYFYAFLFLCSVIMKYLCLVTDKSYYLGFYQI